NTNRPYIHDAKILKDRTPELFERVLKGELGIGQAKAQLRAIETRVHRQEEGTLAQGTDYCVTARYTNEVRVIAGPESQGFPEGDDWPIVWGEQTRRHYRDWLRGMARDIIKIGDVWRAILALAVHLLEAEELDGKEAETLIARFVRTGHHDAR